MHPRLRPLRCALVALALALGASGCLTVGRDFPTHPIERIQMGATTRDQIREWFGPPFRTGVEDGRRTWTYGLYQYALLGEPRTRDLVVRFDDRGVVVSYSFNTTEHGDLSGAP